MSHNLPRVDFKQGAAADTRANTETDPAIGVSHNRGDRATHDRLLLLAAQGRLLTARRLQPRHLERHLLVLPKLLRHCQPPRPSAC